jgi:hypothetical protein
MNIKRRITTDRFLHFLCKPCGDSGCPLYQISFAVSATSKKCRNVGPQRDLFYLLLEPCRCVESARAIFLKCTKKRN